MTKHTTAASNDVDTLADDARALLTATAHAAEEKVVEARNRLAAALDNAKESCGRLQEKAVEGARVADQAVRHHPYESIGIAFGVGALLGFLLTRRN